MSLLRPAGSGPEIGHPGSRVLACRCAGRIWGQSAPDASRPGPGGLPAGGDLEYHGGATGARLSRGGLPGDTQAPPPPRKPHDRHHPAPEALPAGRLPAAAGRRLRPGDRPGGSAPDRRALEPGAPGAADPHPGGRDQGPLRGQGPLPADGGQGGPGRLGRRVLRPGPGPGSGGPHPRRHHHGRGHGHRAGPGPHRPGPDGLHDRGGGALRRSAGGLQPRRRRAERDPGPHLPAG